MRLTLRLLTLALLLGIATFTTLVSPVSHASPCLDGCWRGYEICMGKPNANQGTCAVQEMDCEKKVCKIGMFEDFAIEEGLAQ
jgi:hypothetical protein